MDYRYEEFTVPYENEAIVVRLHTPERDGLDTGSGLLLTFAGDRTASLTVEPYCLAAEVFLAHGHRVLSFDLPNHGSQVDGYGEGITGFRNAFIQGYDPFRRFVERGMAVVDRCMALSIAIPGRIAVCGTSRGGYMALRLLAADERIAAGAGFAPVTDWRDLTEFAGDRMRDDVAALRLSCYAAALATKRVFMVIGNHDERVNTASCCGLYLDMFEARRRQGRSAAALDFYCTDDPGHSCNASWYRRGAEFLLAGVAHPGLFVP